MQTCKAIIDTGACASVLGKITLDNTLQQLSIQHVKETSPRLATHKFGNYDEEHRSISALFMPFECRSNLQNNRDQDQRNTIIEFDIIFDVIPRNIPFLIGTPTLRKMGANINYRYNSLGMSLGGQYHRIPLQQDNCHVYLHFKSSNNPRSHRSLSTQNSTHIRTINFNSTSSHGLTIMKDRTENCKQCEITGYCIPRTSIPLPESTANHQDYYTPMKYTTNHTVTGRTFNQFSRNKSHSPSTQPRASGELSIGQLRKLHLQLKHGTATQMKEWLSSTGSWSPDLQNKIRKVISSCPCIIAHPPPAHPIVSNRVPNRTKLSEVAIDVINIDGYKFLQMLCKCTGYSATALISQKKLSTQIAAFKREWLWKFGAPKIITGDNEYNHPEFLEFVLSIGSKFMPVSAYDHQANGSVESGN